MQLDLKQLFERRRYFNRLFPKLKGSDNRNDIKNLGNTCPSCGYPTLEERCAWEICLICFWEDDGQDDQDADEMYSGPNQGYSLTAHRLEWQRNLAELKNSNTLVAQQLNRIDAIIMSGEKPDPIEIKKLIDDISGSFDQQRNSAL